MHKLFQLYILTQILAFFKKIRIFFLGMAFFLTICRVSYIIKEKNEVLYDRN